MAFDSIRGAEGQAGSGNHLTARVSACKALGFHINTWLRSFPIVFFLPSHRT